MAAFAEILAVGSQINDFWNHTNIQNLCQSLTYHLRKNIFRISLTKKRDKTDTIDDDVTLQPEQIAGNAMIKI